MYHKKDNARFLKVPILFSQHEHRILTGQKPYFQKVLPLFSKPYLNGARGKYYLKVDKNGTSQECPNCGAITGKKALSERVHRCDSCGHIEPRDTASAKVIENRGKNAVGLTVLENARGGDLTGIDQVKPGRSS
ncbi:MAG: hypothetical protein DWQ51_21560 [Microcystis wesenbergii TW10]|jgi:hypothetical protein|nr:MAG: hypothetical protein DWQ51_21560 [Microcystis wesenbergii TW10]TRT83892.1 MAG: hypothetical protein EWV63_16545 [Microcystis aeruginosa Ma_OC_H_19870700_S124]